MTGDKLLACSHKCPSPQCLWLNSHVQHAFWCCNLLLFLLSPPEQPCWWGIRVNLNQAVWFLPPQKKIKLDDDDDDDDDDNDEDDEDDDEYGFWWMLRVFWWLDEWILYMRVHLLYIHEGWGQNLSRWKNLSIKNAKLTVTFKSFCKKCEISWSYLTQVRLVAKATMFCVPKPRWVNLSFFFSL